MESRSVTCSAMCRCKVQSGMKNKRLMMNLKDDTLDSDHQLIVSVSLFISLF